MVFEGEQCIFLCGENSSKVICFHPKILVQCILFLMQVFNGIEHMSPLIDRLCGTDIPDQPIESSGNTMAVVFKSDISVSGRGFSAQYSSNYPAGILADCISYLSSSCLKTSVH